MKRAPTLREFELILQVFSDTDKIGHLFLVDIEFDKKNATEKQIFFNEIYTPVFEKKKVLSANERSVFQLLDAMRLNNTGLINSYKTTAKTQATMDKKFTIPLYAEHLQFLLSKCGWGVRKVRAHYTFEQSKFKNDFVIMYQVSCQNATTDVERNFFKLMNNLNFGFDCRNNANNLFFQPIYDEIEELSYAKKYQNVFDQDISDFVNNPKTKSLIEFDVSFLCNVKCLSVKKK